MNQENTNTTREVLLGPPRVELISVALSGGASIASGMVGGVFMLMCTFFFLSAMQEAAPAILPYALAVTALVGLLLTLFLQFYFARLIFPDKYMGSAQEVIQTFGFNLLLFLLFTPLYVFAGGKDTGNLMIVFSLHTGVATLGSVLIVELISQYRYSLLALYSSFVGFVFSGFITLALFMSTDISKQILFSLTLMIFVSVFSQTLFRTIFEYIYYKLYSTAGLD